MSIHALLGRNPDDPPLVSDDLVATREWIAGGRYLEDTTTGSMAGGIMMGMFTDQGVTGERNAGRIVLTRTVIHVCDNDRHAVELYVMPPGGTEVLAVRMDYTRLHSVASPLPVAESVFARGLPWDLQGSREEKQCPPAFPQP